MSTAPPPGVHLRRGGPEDAERLTDLHLDCWDDAYTGLMPQQILDARRADRAAAIERRRQWLGSPGEVWLADAGAQGLVGFSNAGPCRDPRPAAPWELRALYTRAAWWGTGLGWALHEVALGPAGDAAVSLWALAGNTRALAFYARAGYVEDGGREEHPEGLHLRLVRPARP